MAAPDLATGSRIVEPTMRPHVPGPEVARLRTLTRLVRAIEEELSDEELSDEQKLQNIGERIAAALDGS